MIPVKPSELRALIPAANAPFCDVLRLFWQWAMQRQILRNYCFESDGNGTVTLTDDFKADICNDIDLSAGCANLMSNPTPPPYSGAAFRALIPPATATLCLKTQPAIVNFMEADTRDWEWMFTETSGVPRISEPFRAALCTMGCLGGGGTESCPGFIPSLTLTPGNAKVTLNYTGQGITETGYEYEIYSGATQDLLDAAIAIGVGSSIATGTMTGASFTYEDTGLVNGDTYFYYVRVRKNSGCAWMGTPKNVYAIPSECRLLKLGLDVVSGDFASKTLTIRVRDLDGIGLPSGSTYSVYRGTSAFTLTTLLGSGAIGDATHDGVDPNGKVCLSFEHTDTAVTCDANSFYFTVKLKEAVGCTEYTIGTPSGSPENYPVTSGVVSIESVTNVLNQAGQISALRVTLKMANGQGNQTLGFGKFRLETQSFDSSNNTWTTRAMLPWGPQDGGIFGSNYSITADLPVSALSQMMVLMSQTGSQRNYMVRVRMIPHVISSPCGNFSGTGFDAVFPLVVG